MASKSYAANSHCHGIVPKKFGLVSLEMQRKSVITQVLSKYFVFVMVRDPFSRLASTFHNLLHHGPAKKETFWTRVYGRILKRIRSPNGTSKRREIMFDNFLDYITDPGEDNSNAHWDSYQKLLKPCRIR